MYGGGDGVAGRERQAGIMLLCLQVRRGASRHGIFLPNRWLLTCTNPSAQRNHLGVTQETLVRTQSRKVASSQENPLGRTVLCTR